MSWMSKIVDHVGLGHTNAGVDDGEGLGIDVGDELDVHLFLGVQLAGVGEGLIPNFIQGIGRIGDQLSEEDFLVRVECVNDQGHKLSNLSLEGESFHFFSHFCVVVCIF